MYGTNRLLRHRAKTTLAEDDWHRAQLAYWDKVKEDYDGLYADEWSLRENRMVLTSLAAINLPSIPSVLDLGCGTGLGGDLIKQALGPVKYFGRDVSPGMLEQCRQKHHDAHLSCGSMTDLEAFAPASFDLVTCLFAAGSYAYSLQRLVRGAARILKPTGYLYLSCLSRTALRRLIRLRFTRVELYTTRGDGSGLAGPPVNTYRPADLQKLLQRTSYAIVSCRGMGVMAGVIQWPGLWGISEVVSRRFPSLSHTIEVIAKRSDN